MAYGLTITGFVKPSLEVIRADLDARVRAKFGASVDLGDKSLLGHMNAIMAERLHELWEIAEATNSAYDPDKATGVYLDSLMTLTGSRRPEDAPSRVTLTFTGNAGVVVAANTIAETASTGADFATIESATLVAVTSWVASTAYALDVRRTNASRVYVCTEAGTSAGSGGPTTTADDITDGTVHWRYIGDGTAAGDARAESVEDGPVTATSGDIRQMVTVIAGLAGVRNLLDADLGRLQADDAEARTFRDFDLTAQGNGTAAAMRAAVMRLADRGVISCTVFVNETDFTVDTLPPHSYEVLVRGGDNQEIFDAMVAQHPLGINSHGTVVGSAVDAEGETQVLRLTRPDEIEVYLELNLEIDPSAYPADGDAQVKAAIVAWGDALKPGANVRAAQVSAQIFKVAGVLDVELAQGTAPSPVTANPIVIASRELAVFDTSRINLTSFTGTP